MALASSAAAAFSGACSSDAAALPLKKYDVFISFRGEDTRDTFTSHLYDALCREGLETFIDDRLGKGDEVWPSLVEAIQYSSVFLVIFSKNYASSTWCLNELIEIMKCKKKGDGVVIPVFLRIDPSHVRKQIGSYKTAFTKHEQDSKHSDKIHKWREALFQAANISGFDSRRRTESQLIKDIIKSVSSKLINKYPKEFVDPVIILDENYTRIESSLRIGSGEVQIVGLWSMGGMGKTTIAKVIYHNVCFQYDGACFLADVGEPSKKNEVDYICSRLLSELLGEDLHVNIHQGIRRQVMNRLKQKKVFIVLDDVHSSEIITNLIGVRGKWLGAGSRVIVTTRNKHVLVSGEVDEIYEVKEMNFQNSFQLFNLHAFKKTNPDKGYEKLSERAVAYAKGMPLALKVLGSFLYSKSENEWDSELRGLEKSPNADIQKVLMTSYIGLDANDRSIFLDIACVFKGWGEAKVLELLNACGFCADKGIRNLLDKALISIDYRDRLRMHDLIQEMGREIIYRESTKPGQRSRLWDFKDVCDVLENNTGTEAIQIICFDVGQATHHLHISSCAFTNMRNLRLLVVNKEYGEMKYVHVPRDLKLPNSLIYIRWDDFPSKSLSSSCWEKLVDLSMQNSNMKKLWNGKAELPNLKTIDFRGSKLEECSDLSGAQNLEVLWLTSCRSLRYVDPSFFSHPKLEMLYMNGCTALESLCSNSCSPSLSILCASGCTSLREFSVTMAGGTYLFLGNSRLNKLPSSILRLRNLYWFVFPICESLIDLPETFPANRIWLTDSNKNEHDASIALRAALFGPGFRNVKSLSLKIYETLFELPYNICLLSSLERLVLDQSGVVSLPESIKDLPCLKSLSAYRCSNLQSIPALPQSVEDFDARECTSLNKVLSEMCDPSGSVMNSRTFCLNNCIKLDPDSFHSILKHAIISIERGVLEGDDGDSAGLLYATPYMCRKAKCKRIFYFLPNIVGKARLWFHFYATSIELPADFKFLGFIFFLVLPKFLSRFAHVDLWCECECLVEKGFGERVDVERSSFSKTLRVSPWRSDHVFLWYDAWFCEDIIEATKGRKASDDGTTTCSRKLIFKFHARHEDGEVEVVVIKECGIRWIYPVEDQVAEEGVCEFKGNTEIHEVKVCAVRNGVERSESNEEKDLVPATLNFNQHAFETCSDLEEEELEKFRPSLEELLHIGLGEPFMNKDMKL